MGEAYKELLGERDLLLVQMHAYAASRDSEIRTVAREGFRHLWSVVEQLTGLARGVGSPVLRPGDAHERPRRLRRRFARRVLGPCLPARSRALLRPPAASRAPEPPPMTPDPGSRFAAEASNYSLDTSETAMPTAKSPSSSSQGTTGGGAGAIWAVVITSLALFMATLDNLVVTTALPVIQQTLHSGLAGLEWTVNAYTLTFAVLLLTGRRPRGPVRPTPHVPRRPRRSSPARRPPPRCPRRSAGWSPPEPCKAREAR